MWRCLALVMVLCFPLIHANHINGEIGPFLRPCGSNLVLGARCNCSVSQYGMVGFNTSGSCADGDGCVSQLTSLLCVSPDQIEGPGQFSSYPMVNISWDPNSGMVCPDGYFLDALVPSGSGNRTSTAFATGICKWPTHNFGRSVVTTAVPWVDKKLIAWNMSELNLCLDNYLVVGFQISASAGSSTGDLSDINWLVCALPHPLSCNFPTPNPNSFRVYSDPSCALFLHSLCNFTEFCNTGYAPSTGNSISCSAHGSSGWSPSSVSTAVTCSNIDECTGNCQFSPGPGCNNCSSNAKCADTVGSYTCTCNQGYTGDGFTCTSLPYCNERCATNANSTDVCNNCPTQLMNGPYTYDTQCSAQPGSFTCTCPPGFLAMSGNASFMTQNLCTQLDECSTFTDTCPRDSNNSRIPGSVCVDAAPTASNPTNFFSCQCAFGFTGAPNCSDLDECTKQCANPTQAADPVQYTCNNCDLTRSSCVNLVGKVPQCACLSGYAFNATTGVCEDINECNTFPCAPGPVGTCLNLINKRECMPIITSTLLLGSTNRSAPFTLASTSQSPADLVLITITQPTSGITWDGMFYYGALGQEKAFQANCSTLNATRYLCQMNSGAGANLMFSLTSCLIGGSCSTISHTAFPFSYPPPTLTSGLLCAAGSCGTLVNVSYQTIVTMSGTNFANAKELMQVTFSSSSTVYNCDIQTVNFTSLSCIPANAYESNYKFSVSVGTATASQTVNGSDKFNFVTTGGVAIVSITLPNASATQGCSADTTRTLINCLCVGGAEILVTGTQNFTGTTFLTVDGVIATTINISGPTLRCILPAGVGDARPVFLTTNETNAGPTDYLISYQGPIITGIYYSNSLCIKDPTNNLTLNQCSRAGGQSLSLSGKNFGTSGAVILTNSQNLIATHMNSLSGTAIEPNGLDSYLQFPLLPGSGSQTVIVFQRNGKGSTNLVTYNYAPCSAGTYASGFDCQNCTVGRWSSAGATTCIDCARGSAQSNPGQGGCDFCVPGKASNATGMSYCTLCDLGSSASSPQAISCDLCNAGTYAGTMGSVKCDGCPKGKAANVSGMSICSDCEAGRYSIGALPLCQLCDPGTISIVGQPICISCDPGKYQNQSGQSACTNCTKGTFTDITTIKSLCFPCPSGKYTQFDGQECQACEVGRYQNDSTIAQVGCVNCSVGTVASSKGLTVCTACDAGRFMDKPGGDSCVDCPPGSYMPSDGPKISCLPCTIGRYSPMPASPGCTDCFIGTFQPGQNASVCTQCAPGKKSSVTAATTCTNCSKGFAQPLSGQSDCSACPAGQFTNDSAVPSCQLCPPGYYSGLQATGCTQCAAGKYASDFGKGDCDLCPIGSFNSAQNASTCQLCAAGSFSTTLGALSCLFCSPGTSSLAGKSACAQCTGGTYASNVGQAPCYQCPNGAHVDKNQIMCLCPVGSYSVIASSVSSGRNMTSYLCNECNAGFLCRDEGLTAEALVEGPGYWRPTNSMAVTYRCVNPSLCLGSSQCKPHRVGPMCAICETGYKASGPAGDCGFCSSDNGQTWGYTVGIIALIVFLLCIFYYVVLKVSSSQQIKLEKLAAMKDEQAIQAVEDLQKEFAVDDAYFEAERAQFAAKNTEAEIQNEDLDETPAQETSPEDHRVTKAANDRALIAAQGPASYKSPIFATPASGGRSSMAQVVRPGEKDLPDEVVNERGTFRLRHLSMASRRAPNFMYKVKILVGFFQISSILPLQGEIAWPTAFTAFISAFSILNFDFIPWQSLTCATKITYYGRAMLVGCIPIVVVLALVLFFYVPMYLRDLDSITDQLRKQHKRNNRNRQFIRLLLFTVFLLYPFVSKIVLGIYNCVTVEDTVYLVADFQLHCSDPEWRMYAGICVLFVLMYPIGIPAIYYFILRQSYTRLHEPAVILQFGFLYEAYTDQRWYWELIDLVHKLILTSIVVFAPSSWILGVNMFIIGVYLIMILVFHPYIRKGDDRFHLLTQTELFLLAFMGYIIQRESIIFVNDPVMDGLLSACLIIIVLFLVISFIIIAGRNVHKIWQHAKIKKRAKELKSAASSAYVTDSTSSAEKERTKPAALDL